MKNSGQDDETKEVYETEITVLTADSKENGPLNKLENHWKGHLFW